MEAVQWVDPASLIGRMDEWMDEWVEGEWKVDMVL
jgi:hypothetical protein